MASCAVVSFRPALQAAPRRQATREPVDWPTPILPDAELEYWAQRYRQQRLDRLGPRFILFLQCPEKFLYRGSAAP